MISDYYDCEDYDWYPDDDESDIEWGENGFVGDAVGELPLSYFDTSEDDEEDED